MSGSQTLNTLFNEPILECAFFKPLLSNPLEFVDVGSMGGVHPLIYPVASLSHSLCFETDESKCEELRGQAKQEQYGKITVCPTGLFDSEKEQTLFITEADTNTSLLEPSSDFIERYNAVKFKQKKQTQISVQRFDTIIDSLLGVNYFGELFKLDTQGSEFEILLGAEQSLKHKCLAVFCEVEFLEVYNSQKRFSEIEVFLREHGLNFYYLSPNYRSTKRLIHSPYTSRERFMWADTLFLKDPLDKNNQTRSFSDRQITILFIIALLFQFYDYALELLIHYCEDSVERHLIEQRIVDLSLDFRKYLEKNPEIKNPLFGF